jgi:hypothetical protein
MRERLPCVSHEPLPIRLRTSTARLGEPSDSGSMRLSCYPLGGFDVHGMKSLRSMLDVKTDRIYHSVSAGKCIRD